MNTRLLQFLSAENINQSQFADSIGVARASISHILAGRNKPGFEFIENTMKRYPDLNIEWLITGKGKMYKTSAYSPSLFDDDAPAVDPEPVAEPPAVSEPAPSSLAQKKPLNMSSERNISRIIVFYDDNSYQEFIENGD